MDENLPVANSEVCLCVCVGKTAICTRVCARVKAEWRQGVGGGLSFYSWEAKIQPRMKKKTKVKEERDACGGEGRRCGCRVEVVEEVRSAEGLLNLTGIHPGRGAEEHSSDVRAAKAAGMR